MIGITLVLCLVFCQYYSYPINVKIVREPNSLSNNFNQNIKVSKIAANFVGPSHLIYLTEKCFTYLTDKYDYRVCPFNNITQHEKVWHSGSFNGVIGIWKEWSVKNNSFDSLVFTDGDDCGEGVQRSAKMIWICNQEINETIDRVIDLTEPEKCFYEIRLASNFGCENKYIYTHLKEDYKQKWDGIESNYFYGELTQFGYESALKELFIESGIMNSTENSLDSNEKCLEYILLKVENKKLIKRIKFLETQLKNKD